MKLEKGSSSIYFSEFDDFIDYLEEKGGQGGGYSWETMVNAVLELRNINISDVEMDPEGDTFVAFGTNEESLKSIAGIIKELVENRSLMSQAVEHAKTQGYFE
jgi:hypothetical protein